MIGHICMTDHILRTPTPNIKLQKWSEGWRVKQDFTFFILDTTSIFTIEAHTSIFEIHMTFFSPPKENIKIIMTFCLKTKTDIISNAFALKIYWN